MNFFSRSATGMFASQSLLAHLLRGAIAIGLLAWAVQYQTHTALSLLAAAGALIALRGCPICWTIGLVETLAQKRKRPVAKT